MVNLGSAKCQKFTKTNLNGTVFENVIWVFFFGRFLSVCLTV